MTAAAATRNARADLYALLAELLSYPGPTLGEELRAGGVQAAVAHLAAHSGLDLEPLLDKLTASDLPGAELEAEFIRLFDAPDGASTPLYTGVYSHLRRDAMEELLRFYRHFGLTVSDDDHDLPDYVPTVLEFLSFLALRSAVAETDEARFATDAAAADIIGRHLHPWASHTIERFGGRRPHPFYAAVVALVAVIAEAELDQPQGG